MQRVCVVGDQVVAVEFFGGAKAFQGAFGVDRFDRDARSVATFVALAVADVGEQREGEPALKRVALVRAPVAGRTDLPRNT